MFLFVFAATIMGVVFVLWSLQREPGFYRDAKSKLDNSTYRQQQAAEFERRTEEMMHLSHIKPEWEQTFTQDQINACLMEGYGTKSSSRRKKDVSSPLLEFGDGVVRIGVELDTELYQGIISIETKPTLNEDRNLALEVTSIRVGSMPIPASSLLKMAVEEISRGEESIRWGGDANRDIVIIKLPDPTHEFESSELTMFQVTNGELTLKGKRR